MAGLGEEAEADDYAMLPPGFAERLGQNILKLRAAQPSGNGDTQPAFLPLHEGRPWP